MRRKDREVTSPEEIEAIIQKCSTCHLAMFDGEFPYVIPLSYGYRLSAGALELFFHAAREGKKIECLKKRAEVAFSLCAEGEIFIHPELSCRSSRFYESVVGQGRVQFIETPKEKVEALSLLMENQSRNLFKSGDFFDFHFEEEMLSRVKVFKVIAERFFGKRKV